MGRAASNGVTLSCLVTSELVEVLWSWWGRPLRQRPVKFSLVEAQPRDPCTFASITLDVKGRVIERRFVCDNFIVFHASMIT